MAWDFDERAHLHEIKHAIDALSRKLDEHAHKSDAIFRLLVDLNRKVDRMTIDVSKLQPVVDQIKTDQAKNAADIMAAIDKLVAASAPGSEPALVQAAIDQAVTDLTAVASGMEASNASVEAALNPLTPPAA